MANGFFGKILWIDLSKETFKEEILPEEIYRQYLGGYALACRLIYENTPPKYDPLGLEAILGFVPGLLTGSVAPISGRFMVTGKSPLTGTWGDANCGGYFGPEIKKCGYDGLFVKGMADNPKYVIISDDDKQILDASDIWGLDTIDTENNLKKKHGRVQTASIGPAGEKLSLISGVVNDKGRIAARSGLGAVMGSKRLKSIVLKGNKNISVSNKEMLNKYTREYNKGIQNSGPGSIEVYKKLGTSGLNVVCGQSGDSPIKNWGGNAIDDFPINKLEKISGEEINKFRQRKYGCFSCSVQCGGIVKVPEAGIEESHIPEYETSAAFGHLLLNNDIISLFIINDLCNRGGIDTISTGGTIAFAIECFENGLITKEDTGGLELTWGNSKTIIELVKLMINRKGFGDVLADGSKKASERIGNGSEKYAIHSMGQEPGMHDAKFFKSLAMSYAFDPTPGRHNTGNIDMMAIGVLMKPNGFIEGISLPKKFKRAGDDERFEAQKLVISLRQVMNALGMCEFTDIYIKYPLLEIIKAVVGWDINVDELLKVGRRIQTLRQAFTLREGVILAKNELPGRIYGNPPFESGPHKRKTIDYKEDYRGYCEKMGWNPDGIPLKETLTGLNLDFVIKDLY